MNINYKINKYTFRYGISTDELKKQIYKQKLNHYGKQTGGSSIERIKDITNKNILFFGCGAVAKAVICYINKFFIIDPKKVIIIDLIDNRNQPDVADLLARGATYQVSDLNKSYIEFINKLTPYDFVIDLTSQTSSIEFMKKCKKQNVHYINTSIEYDEGLDFDDSDAITDKDICEFSYLKAQKDALDINKAFPKNNATMVPTFGFNPGMVSMMIKTGIMFMAKKEPKNKDLDTYIKNKAWSKLAQYLGIEVIHCSETDNSEYLDMKDDKKDVFVNTWCVQSFLQEGIIDKCEFGYGSAQKTIPPDSIKLNDCIISMRKPAPYFYSESYVPTDGKIVGIMIPHSESISGPLFFSDETTGYHPTAHYAYKWSPIVHRSLKRLESDKKILQKTHVINNYEDKFKGIDRVGALILAKDKKAVWAGSILDNSQLTTSSATLVQVAVSVLAAMRWMVDNPTMNIVFPETLDEEYLLKLATPYLGTVFCDFVDYQPKSLQFGDMQRTKEQFDAQYTITEKQT